MQFRTIGTIIIIFAVPYFYNKNVENNIWDKTLNICKTMNYKDCDTLEERHHECFESSYRFTFRSMSFYEDEYNICMNMHNKY